MIVRCNENQETCESGIQDDCGETYFDLKSYYLPAAWCPDTSDMSALLSGDRNSGSR